MSSRNRLCPKGEEFTSIDESIRRIEKYVNLPVVIKPKSTNFGLGISIFPDGGGKEELTKALDFAFSKDNTVLIEEFIKGKEFRFLVIGDKVSGILHRVPANVKGDGKHTIEELIEIKNKDSLRGKGRIQQVECRKHRHRLRHRRYPGGPGTTRGRMRRSCRAARVG